MSEKTITNRKREEIKSPHGTVYVFGPAYPEEIKRMSMDETLNSFREPERQKEALAEIAALPKAQIYIASFNEVIVGYVTFHPPEVFERWGQSDLECLLELGAIEVSRHFRGLGLAVSMMKIAFCEGNMEDYIVIATEYYWHWDLEGSGMHIWEYRKMLESVMASVGLRPKETNDPEINVHPANVLMVRIGKNVSEEEAAVFEDLCHREEDELEWFE